MRARSNDALDGKAIVRTPHRAATKLQQPHKLLKTGATVSLVAAMLALSACKTEQVFTNGPSIEDQQLALVAEGSSRDQVLLALGTPSTTGTFDNEVFYYITQKRSRKLAYQKLRLIDQRVVAIYFNAEDTVERVADYGIEDGKVIDFISRTTPTGGKDETFLQRLFSSTGSGVTAPPPLSGGSGF